uniref:Immunoglobulin V-set domain-containing protein n=1 Tax=Cyclopterus lumpus TaxID=8103 RepID=A0A8C3G4Y0_CYCLU
SSFLCSSVFLFKITSQCSVTLGGSVSIQLMTNASGQQLWCKKKLTSGSINIFSLKKEKVTIQGPYRNRTEFFINNGTLKITKVERNDSGEYTVDVFDPNGILLRTMNVKLDVQGKCLEPSSLPVYSC